MAAEFRALRLDGYEAELLEVVIEHEGSANAEFLHKNHCCSS